MHYAPEMADIGPGATSWSQERARVRPAPRLTEPQKEPFRGWFETDTAGHASDFGGPRPGSARRRGDLAPVRGLRMSVYAHVTPQRPYATTRVPGSPAICLPAFSSRSDPPARSRSGNSCRSSRCAGRLLGHARAFVPAS